MNRVYAKNIFLKKLGRIAVALLFTLALCPVVECGSPKNPKGCAEWAAHSHGNHHACCAHNIHENCSGPSRACSQAAILSKFLRLFAGERGPVPSGLRSNLSHEVFMGLRRVSTAPPPLAFPPVLRI